MVVDGPQRHRALSAIGVNLLNMHTHVSPFLPQRELKFSPSNRNRRQSGINELPVTQNID